MKFIHLSLMFLVGLGAFQSCDNKPREGAVLQHNVYFYLKKDLTEAQKNEVLDGIRHVLTIESILYSEIGKPAATPPRPVVDHEFDFVIYTWFTSMENYKTYDKDPKHEQFRENYSDYFEKVIIYDADLFD